MKYDFTSILDRRGKDAIAVDLVGAPGSEYPSPRDGFDVIPMWVADMNFPVVPTVVEAMKARADHPSFGYFAPTQAYFDSIINWHRTHNGAHDLRAEHIGYENGVLGGLASALAVLCSHGDSVLVHAPTYVGFTRTLENNGYHIVNSELKLDENGIYRMDFADMEQKIVENKIHAAIFCSPHNPTGRVWERWEIEQAMELYRKHNVFVISDEIWSDILLSGSHHIPTQSVSEDARERTIAFYAPSKTFNLAGLVGSYHIIYNAWLRERVDKQSSLCHYNSMNVMSMHALLGAYCPEGSEWVEELKQTLTKNADYAVDFIRNHFEGVRVSRPQGTYMLFIDCEQWCKVHGVQIGDVLKAGWDVGVIWQDGRPFHGKTHIRMNLALPFTRVCEAFERLDRYVFNCGK